ncbi:hypothetical protein ACS77P_05825 [Yersinia enterocolitica]|uniref:hypothetical protein n=1 Tax=Yersinia enterocolitica TaxID=630 RepID=UPI003F420613
MKKLKFDFRLSHILFFFFGVMVTVVLLWILYKDPTRITAPALAALTAMCTFLLALWSAFKVNKWLNSKVNDAAFKQTEKVLGYIENSNKVVDPIHRNFLNIKTMESQFGLFKFNENGTKELIILSKNVDTYCDDLSMSIMMLKYWNSELSKQGNKFIYDFINSLRLISKMILNLPDTNDAEEFKKNIIGIEDKFNESFSKLSMVLKFNYNELFIHNVKPTSPVKKVSE